MFKRNKDNEYEFYIADMGECEALFDKLDPLYEEQKKGEKDIDAKGTHYYYSPE